MILHLGTNILTVSILFRVLVYRKKYSCIVIHYSNATKFARGGLLFISYFKVINISFEIFNTEPYRFSAEMILNRNNVNMRHDANERIINIAKNSVESINSKKYYFESYLNKESTKSIFLSYIQYEISSKIANSVFIAYYFHSMIERNDNSDNYIVCLPDTWWIKYAIQELSFIDTKYILYKEPIYIHLLDSVKKIVDKIVLKFKRDNLNIEANIASSPRLPDITLPSEYKTNNDNINENSKVGCIARDGIDPRLRNNISWAWDTDIPLSKLVVGIGFIYRECTEFEKYLVDKSIIKSLVTTEIAENNGFLLKPIKSINIKTRLKILFIYAKLFCDYIFTFRISKIQFWIYWNLYIIEQNSYIWIKIFRDNNVRVFIENDYGRGHYYRALAIRRLDGIMILNQRCQYYDNMNYIIVRTGDIYFTSGAHGLRYIRPENIPINNFVVTGFSWDTSEKWHIKNIHKDKNNKIINENRKLPVGVLFDEPGMMHSPKMVADFYEKILTNLSKHRNHILLIKPKHHLTWSNLSLKSTKLIAELESQEYIKVIHFTYSTSEIVSDADFVVTVPSTAMFTPISLNIPTIIFNPFHTIRNVFYEFDLGDKCIFDDLDKMVAAVNNLVAKNDLSIGDCSVLRSTIDTMGKSDGNSKKAEFIKALLNSLDKGMDRKNAIAASINSYQKKFGEGYAGSWEQVWSGTGGINSSLKINVPQYDFSM